MTKPQERLRGGLTLGWPPGGGGDGDTPWYKLYRYVPPQREYVLRRFGLEIGYGFWETKGVYERIYRLIPNE